MSAEAPRPDPAELLEQRAWMRRFAAALAGGEGEDVVQDAWLRLLARPVPALARPRAWLASLLRNAARMRAREHERRTARERRAAPEERSAPSADELAARAELEQLAVRAVLALDEPFREALLLRYVQGLEPTEIAHALRVPASTVRNRIARGLELVRARLDARHGGERDAWAVLLAPLSGAGLVTGGALVGTKWIAAGIVALVAAAWWVGRSGSEVEERSGPAGVGSEGAPTLAPAADAGAPARLAETTGTSRTSVESTASGATGSRLATVVVRATWHDGSPAAGLVVRLLELDAPVRTREHELRCDDAGLARLEGLEPGRGSVSALRSEALVFELAAGEERAVDLVIPRGVDVLCRVVDEHGASIAGAEVWLSAQDSDSHGTVIDVTAADGALLVKHVGLGQHLAARGNGYAPSAQEVVLASPGSTVGITLVLPARGAALSGTVLDARGAAIAHAELLLGPRTPASVTNAYGTLVPGPPPLTLRCDAGGRFLAPSLPPGPLPVALRAQGFAPHEERLELAPGETTDATFTLLPEAHVQGVVRDGSGHPLADVTVSSDGAGSFTSSRTHSAPDGSYELGSLRDRGAWLMAWHAEHGTTREALALVSGRTARWDPVLAAGRRIAGRVVDERDTALEGWRVVAVERSPTAPRRPVVESDALGRFDLPNVPASPFVVEVRSRLDPEGEPVLVVEDVVPGASELVLRVLDDDAPSCFVTGRVRAADGRELDQPRVAYGGPSRTGFAAPLDADGRFRIGPLRPATYALEASAIGMAPLYLGEHALAPRETRDLGELALEAAGRVRATLRAPDGAPRSLEVASLVYAGRRLADAIEYAEREGSSGPLARGVYVLRTRGALWYAPEREVEVVPGETIDVELVLQRATSRLLVLTLPAGDRATSVHVLVRDARGATVEDYGGTSREGERFVLSLAGLVPGTYSVEARTDTGLVAAESFVVLDLERPDEPLELSLR